MDAIILAGGLGTRLQTVISHVPKPLAPINGVPFLDILLHQLNNSKKIKKVVLAVSFKAEMVLLYYKQVAAKKWPSLKIIFSIEKEPLGTGGAMKQALSFVDSENVLVMNGDSYIDFDTETLTIQHEKEKAFLTLVLREVPDSSRYGTVKMDTSTKTVFSFEEKNTDKKSGLIYGGVCITKKNVFDVFPIKKAVLSFEKEVMPVLLVSNYRIKGVVTQGRFIDIGTPESYKQAQTYLEKIT